MVKEARERVLGAKNPLGLAANEDLASLYNSKAIFGELRDLGTKVTDLVADVVKVSSEVLGDGHPITLNNMAKLAPIYNFQDNRGYAEDLVDQIIIKSRIALGGGRYHPTH